MYTNITILLIARSCEINRINRNLVILKITFLIQGSYCNYNDIFRAVQMYRIIWTKFISIMISIQFRKKFIAWNTTLVGYKHTSVLLFSRERRASVFNYNSLNWNLIELRSFQLKHLSIQVLIWLLDILHRKFLVRTRIIVYNNEKSRNTWNVYPPIMLTRTCLSKSNVFITNISYRVFWDLRYILVPSMAACIYIACNLCIWLEIYSKYLRVFKSWSLWLMGKKQRYT